MLWIVGAGSLGSCILLHYYSAVMRLNDSVFRKSRMKTVQQDSSCVIAWFLGGVKCGFPHPWQPKGSLVWNKPLILYWWIWTLLAEFRRVVPSTEFCPNHSSDFFTPFIVQNPVEFKLRLLKVQKEIEKCCIVPMQWNNCCISSLVQALFISFSLSSNGSQRWQPWKQTLCNILQRLNQV